MLAFKVNKGGVKKPGYAEKCSLLPKDSKYGFQFMSIPYFVMNWLTNYFYKHSELEFYVKSVSFN